MKRWLPLAAYLLAVVLAAYCSGRRISCRPSPNRVANELAQNGLSSFVRAALTNEIDYQANYRSDDPKDNLAIVTRELERGGGTFTRLADGRLDRAFPGRPDGLGRLNVVLVSSESFGAEFSRLYGSERDLTPNFDAFAQQGHLVLARLRIRDADGARPRGLHELDSADSDRVDPAPAGFRERRDLGRGDALARLPDELPLRWLRLLRQHERVLRRQRLRCPGPPLDRQGALSRTSGASPTRTCSTTRLPTSTASTRRASRSSRSS